jgi:hypothetical protein
MNESLDHEINFKEGDKIITLYDAQNFASFIKYFSLRSLYHECRETLKAPKVKIVFLINQKKQLMKEYYFRDRTSETPLITQLVANIEDIYRADERYGLYSSFDIFSFSSGLNYLGSTSNLLAKDYKDETLLKEELTSEFKPYCDLPKVLSKLFNEIDSSNKRECFIRIVMVTGQTDISYEKSHVLNVINTYTHHYTPVFNFIFLETDYMLGNVIQSHLLPHIDYKENVHQAERLPEKLRNLMLSIDYEIDIAKVVSKLMAQVDELFNDDKLVQFIDQFDSAFKEYKELFEYQVSKKQMIKAYSISYTKREKIYQEVQDCIGEKKLLWQFCEKVRAVVRAKDSDIVKNLVKKLEGIRELHKDIDYFEVSIEQKGKACVYL